MIESAPRRRPPLRLLRVLSLAVGLLLLFLAGLALLHGFEPPLTPAAQALFAAEPAPAPADAQNLALAMEGFDAPAGVDMVAEGRRRQSLLAPLSVRHARDARVPFPDSLPGELVRSNADGCGVGRADFLLRAPALVAGYRPTDAERELDRRYLSLPDYPIFASLRPPLASPWPPAASHVIESACVFAMRMAVEVQSADAAVRRAALALLRRDIGMWQVVLAGACDDATARLAGIELANRWIILAHAMALDGDAATTFLGLAPGSPWTPAAAYAPVAALMFDARMYAAAMAKPFETHVNLEHSITGGLARLFFSRNDTINFIAAENAQLVALATGPPATLEARRRAFLRWQRDATSLLHWGGVFNPLGRSMMSLATAVSLDLPERLQDDAALERMVHLDVEIHRLGLKADQVVGFMDAHPELSTHPVTGQRFAYDASTSELSFPKFDAHVPTARQHILIWQTQVR